jgi:hypothetical protein
VSRTDGETAVPWTGGTTDDAIFQAESGTTIPMSQYHVSGSNGKVEFDGQAYDSLSTAAGMARKSVIGAPAGRPYPQTNGWTFWMYSDEDGGKLREIDHLRQIGSVVLAPV